MNYILKNLNIFGSDNCAVYIENGIISSKFNYDSSRCEEIDCSGLTAFPGFVDVHVHLREPGFSYKETIKTGSMAGAAGGYTAIGAMPNLSPVPDCTESLDIQLKLIEKDAAIRVLPYGSITAGEKGEKLSDMEGMAKSVIAFSDDGKGVQDEGMMRAAMEMAKSLGKIIAAHCEDETLLFGGCIHDGEYARAHGIPGISSESEWRQIERDIRLSADTGCAYHVCHVSTKESVALIRDAKKSGVDITCETAPHYLVFNDTQLKDLGSFRMNPPIRSEDDRLALIGGILDGTVDMIATDHAPHSSEEKSRGLRGSLNGIVGLETAFPVLYTKLVKTGVISLEKLIELMHFNPCRRFGINMGIKPGQAAGIAVYDLEKSYAVNPEEFQSMGRSTPFAGMEVTGRCLMTVCGDKIPWRQI